MSILDRHPAPWVKVETESGRYIVIDANCKSNVVVDDSEDADFVCVLS